MLIVETQAVAELTAAHVGRHAEDLGLDLAHQLDDADVVTRLLDRATVLLEALGRNGEVVALYSLFGIVSWGEVGVSGLTGAWSPGSF